MLLYNRNQHNILKLFSTSLKKKKKGILNGSLSQREEQDSVSISNLKCRGRVHMGIPRWLSGKESACQCRRCWRHGFNPWVRNIPW